MRATRPIGLAAQCVPNLSPEETIRVATTAGFDLAGITIDRESWTSARATEVRRVAETEGVGLIDAEVIRLRGIGDPGDLKHVDYAAEAGVAHVLIVGFMPDRTQLIDAVGALADHARRARARAILEFGAFTDVASLADAVAVAAAVPDLAILVDPLHLARSGGAPADVAALAPELLPYVQWCDAGPAIFGQDRAGLLREACDHRLDVGDGTLPLAALLAALPPGLPLVTEVRSLAVARRFPDPVDHARHLHSSMTAWLAGQGDKA